MVSPENEKHWGKMLFITIAEFSSYTFQDVFCDENGNTNLNLPVSLGKNTFSKTKNGTRVEFNTAYNSEEEVHKLIDIGFEQGIRMTFEELAYLVENGKI